MSAFLFLQPIFPKINKSKIVSKFTQQRRKPPFIWDQELKKLIFRD
jgi:hypothetical protein